MFFKRHSQGADGWRAAAHQPRRLQALRTERPPHRAARGPLLPRPRPRWPRNQGHRLLLNSPGRKLQGAGGRCGGFSKACGGALLAGTRARCPQSPLQTLGPPAAVHPARAHRSLCSRKPPGSFGTHLGIPPGGAGGQSRAAGWLRRSAVSPAGRLPFLGAPRGGRENNEPAGQTEDRLTHLHTQKRGSNG